MILPSDPRTSVFCDWLDTTSPPSEEMRLRSELGPLLCALDGIKLGEDHYEVGGGTVKLHQKRGVFRCSFSGTAISYLMQTGHWQSVLAVIGCGPHRVTRLDAAVDLAHDGADAIEALQAAFPRGEVRVTQRPVRITEFLSVRPDGRRTGTWYAGHRSQAEVTLRIYDKAWEVAQRTGADYEGPRTRVELTVRKGPGPTLRDAWDPDRLFWHYVAPKFMRGPVDVPRWDPGWAEGWKMERVEILPAQALKRRVETSGEIAALLELADSLGPHGRQYLRGLLDRRCAGSGHAEVSGSLRGQVS